MSIKQTIDTLLKAEESRCAAISIQQKQESVKQLNTPYVTVKPYESLKLKILRVCRKCLGK